MEAIAIIKLILLVGSGVTLLLSLIFLLSPELYLRLENFFNKDLIRSVEFFTALEGHIDFLNDWVFEHREIFGTLFVLLSLYNIKSLILL